MECPLGVRPSPCVSNSHVIQRFLTRRDTSLRQVCIHRGLHKIYLKVQVQILLELMYRLGITFPCHVQPRTLPSKSPLETLGAGMIT